MAVEADDPASASTIWRAVLPLIPDVGQAEVRFAAADREASLVGARDRVSLFDSGLRAVIKPGVRCHRLIARAALTG